MTFKVLIADDDEGMRLVLNKLVKNYSDFNIIGEASNGNEALDFAVRLNPDVIFMDVEMPGINGIECAKKVLELNPKTIIIFVTAHEEYMPEAFELYALDYMVKPFKIERVQKTLNRIKELFNTLENESHENRAVKQIKSLDKLIIRNKEGISFINTKDIIIIQREDRSTVIYTANERFITSEALTDLEDKLDSGIFFRSHKSYIINLTMISKIQPYGRWTYIVKMKNTDMDALLTHEKFEELQSMFN